MTTEHQQVHTAEAPARELPAWAAHVPSEPITINQAELLTAPTMSQAWSDWWWQFRTDWRSRTHRVHTRYGLSIRDLSIVTLLLMVNWFSADAIRQMSHEQGATYWPGVILGVWTGALGMMTLHWLLAIGLSMWSARQRRAQSPEAGHGA